MSLVPLPLVLFAVMAPSAVEELTPEVCLPGPGEAVVESVVHGGKRYDFKRAGCKALFESDVERYSQLFDALAQLAASGRPRPPRAVSAVPS